MSEHLESEQNIKKKTITQKNKVKTKKTNQDVSRECYSINKKERERWRERDSEQRKGVTSEK